MFNAETDDDDLTHHIRNFILDESEMRDGGRVKENKLLRIVYVLRLSRRREGASSIKLYF
jgi:hypothetical protein